MINFLFCCHKANITLPAVIVFPVTSLLERLCKKDPGPSQALEEPPVLESTSKEIPQTRKRGTVNTENVLQLSVVVDYLAYLYKTVTRFSVYLISEKC